MTSGVAFLFVCLYTSIIQYKLLGDKLKLEDCFVGQKVGLHYDGEVLTGVIEPLDGNIATVYLSGLGSDNKVNVKYLLGVVKGVMK